MGIVTDHLISAVAKQVNDHCLVVWYDPEKHYTDIARDLSLPSATVARYEGSFFALRRRIDHLMGGTEPPRLVVYVPEDPAKTHDALAELEAAGVVMKPGQQPPGRNTRLSVIARNALRPLLGDDAAAAVASQADNGKLSLADLDALAEKGEGITKGVVSLIFGTGNPQDVALGLLSGTRFDDEIRKKEAGAELAVLLGSAFDLDVPAGTTPQDVRARLARQVLTTDFLASMHGEVPPRLAEASAAAKPAAKDACAALARTWRLRRDLRDSYVEHASTVEKELGLTGVELDTSALAAIETFLEIEYRLQTGVEAGLLDATDDDLVETARARQSSFWAECLPDVQARWALVATTGQLLLEADRVEQELKTALPDVSAFLASYTGGNRPWCLLDTYHRHMERLYHNFDFDLGPRHATLKQLIHKARHRYMTVGAAIADEFMRCLQEAKYRLPGLMHQTEIYDKRVKPKAAEGKTAYVWVDALRFEMGHELAQTLSGELKLTVEPALAAVPTITEIGMAALLPGASESASVLPVAESKLGLEIGGKVIKDRDDRVAFLKERAGVKVYETKLESLLPSPKKKVEDAIRAADLVLVTSQEIDDLGERDNVPLARRTMDGMLHELRRAVRVLGNLGVVNVVIAADHGYLFGEELESDMKINAPGGETADIHRRVWVGRGGGADPSYLRARLSDFGLGGGLEIAAPRGFACFKVKGGAKAYFHGGLSPQEIIIPVISVAAGTQPAALVGGGVDWTITLGSQKISTRFVSVQIRGVATGLFELVPPRVRVEVTAKGESISTPVSASYGFEEATGDVQLREAGGGEKAVEPNTVALAITKETSQKTVTVRLLDAASGAELTRREGVEVAISI